MCDGLFEMHREKAQGGNWTTDCKSSFGKHLQWLVFRTLCQQHSPLLLSQSNGETDFCSPDIYPSGKKRSTRYANLIDTGWEMTKKCHLVFLVFPTEPGLMRVLLLHCLCPENSGVPLGSGRASSKESKEG